MLLYIMNYYYYMLLPIDEYEFHQSPCYWVLLHVRVFSFEKNVRQFTGDWSYPGMLAHPRRPQCPTTSLALPHDRNFLPPKDGHVLNVKWPRMAQEFETDKMGGLKVVSLRLASEDTKAERPGFLYRNFSGIGSSHSKHRSIQPAAVKKMCDVPVPSLSHGENVAGRRSTPADHVQLHAMRRRKETKSKTVTRDPRNKRLEASWGPISTIGSSCHGKMLWPWALLLLCVRSDAQGIQNPLRQLHLDQDQAILELQGSEHKMDDVDPFFWVGPMGPKNTKNMCFTTGDVSMIFHYFERRDDAMDWFSFGGRENPLQCVFDPWMAWRDLKGSSK